MTITSKPMIGRVLVNANTKGYTDYTRLVSSKTKVVSATLDTLRASRIMSEILGFKTFEMLDSGDDFVVFGIQNFHDAVAPLTKQYGSARNESDRQSVVKRLVWDVKSVKGSVTLHQAANQKPILIFTQH
jgi:hypothetical protein